MHKAGEWNAVSRAATPTPTQEQFHKDMCSYTVLQPIPMKQFFLFYLLTLAALTISLKAETCLSTQASLIHQDTAKTLGLKGKDVSIAITKIGDKDKTMKTKEYNVQLTCIDTNKHCTVKAIVIHCISDKILAVKTLHLPEVLG